MKDCREEWYDATSRVAVTFVDVATAAQDLARAHLSGPTSAHCLARALAAAALLGSEVSEADEVVSVQMKCQGPLGGFNVECAADGALRGYTERKTLDGFDGFGTFDDRKVIGQRQVQVTRSVPGRIVSQGISSSLDGFLAGSLQRRAAIYLEASVTDEVEVLEARGMLVEALPDAAESAVGQFVTRPAELAKPGWLAVSPRTLLGRLGLGKAELRRTSPLRFACRCSPARAAAMLGALGPVERSALPASIDVTCHMCGRTFTVNTGFLKEAEK